MPTIGLFSTLYVTFILIEYIAKATRSIFDTSRLIYYDLMNFKNWFGSLFGKNPQAENTQQWGRENHEHQSQDDDFDPSKFQDMPYGVNKRHPDDMKKWAYVDDPAASPQERRTALEKILIAEEKRETKSLATRKDI